METFCILCAIVVIGILLAKGMSKIVGPLGCCVIVIIFLLFTCQEYNEMEEKERINEEKAEKAYEDIRKRKEEYHKQDLYYKQKRENELNRKK